MTQERKQISLPRDCTLAKAIGIFSRVIGFRSLSQRIPADELKIDKSFVMGMTRDTGDHRLVRAIIDLARHFNLEVVAKGVENPETLTALAQLGCNYAQGYLFSPALSRLDLAEWLRLNRRDLRLNPAIAPASPFTD